MTLGDESQVDWEFAPQWQKDSSIAGVLFVMDNPSYSPGDTHRSWLKQKEADGWTFGEQKDPVLKRHPCMVPFEELPVAAQKKDHLFLAIVKAMI